MAVDLTADQLRTFLGENNLTEDRAGELLEIAKARVEQYAPLASTALQNESVRRLSGNEWTQRPWVWFGPVDEGRRSG